MEDGVWLSSPPSAYHICSVKRAHQIGHHTIHFWSYKSYTRQLFSHNDDNTLSLPMLQTCDCSTSQERSLITRFSQNYDTMKNLFRLPLFCCLNSRQVNFHVITSFSKWKGSCIKLFHSSIHRSLKKKKLGFMVKKISYFQPQFKHSKIEGNSKEGNIIFTK